MSLKQDWKEVGRDFKKVGIDLTKSIFKSVRAGVNNATEWAEKDNNKSTSVPEYDNVVDVSEDELN